jgi:hypothetical protein
MDPDAKVLRTYLLDGRLKQIPSKRSKRDVVLRHLIESFEGERVYNEREVNEILARFHEDVATLRREFIAAGLMVRHRGMYARPD